MLVVHWCGFWSNFSSHSKFSSTTCFDLFINGGGGHLMAVQHMYMVLIRWCSVCDALCCVVHLRSN